MGSTLKTSEVMDDGEEDFVVEGGDGGQYKHMKEKKMLLDTYLISFFLMQIAGFLAFLATPRFQDNAKIAGFIASLQLLKLKIMLCASVRDLLRSLKIIMSVKLKVIAPLQARMVSMR
ncbi:uncharacterized protein LOC109803800 isoform X2 [Cajanus cajan]|uniref:uncharacterized protein LOC109803800 isoform X2 n=1 Tax=Cajanus cajan TaxID=3821 RepID=UPI0010FB1379|nr:uncharacterized protein LOC109803800 isoform X2 [Cajanus cajan]